MSSPAPIANRVITHPHVTSLHLVTGYHSNNTQQLEIIIHPDAQMTIQIISYGIYKY